MIKAVIVDDEANARTGFRTMLKIYAPEVEVIGEASSVETAILLLSNSNPDVVFLDIEMQDGTGFEVLQRLPTIDFKVVFVTAYEQYALQSFRFAAIDYILKPIRIQDLQEAVQKVASGQKSKIASGSEFSEIKRKVDASKEGDQMILIAELDGFSVAKHSDVAYCEAAKNYTVFHFLDGRTQLASRTLGEYEELLRERGFMRIHKSFLISLTKVKRYLKGRGGEVEMENGSLLPVSRDRKQKFLEHFESRFGMSTNL